MDTSLWPDRNVAEYAYCPRLFYYMEVEGIHLQSHDTEEGQRIHKRVDAPSSARAKSSAGDDEPVSVRSLTLTDPSLGLTATLDLAEINGNVAVPIEYRKGRPQSLYQDEQGDDDSTDGTSFEPWPTDRIQVGFQALLLERAGYSVPRAVLYYAAIRRRIEIAVDEQLRRDALDILDAAQRCAAGPRPLPLVNDPKCPRCSLQPICLPDEINAQRDCDTCSPRKLWPPRDDGIHLVAQRQGTRVGIRGASLKITESDGTTSQEIPLANVESLSLLGTVQISTQSLHTLADRSIPDAFLSAAGRLVTMVDPLDSVSADTRRNQVRQIDQPAASLALSRQLIASKIRNQRTLLIRNCDALPKPVAKALAAQAAAAERAESIESLRGHEGQAAALYFEHFAGMVTCSAILTSAPNSFTTSPCRVDRRET